MKFSILIPTWNNLPYLKLCVDSIRKNSAFAHEILIHVNEGSDGTLAWLSQENIRYTQSAKNVGVCMSTNEAAGLATEEWIVFLNDDMFCCPGWDLALSEAIKKAENDLLFLSARLIEPTGETNNRMLVKDCGTTPENFDEAKLMQCYQASPIGDQWGVASQPSVLSRRLWHMVGGYSVEFSPGMCSDDDLLVKLWMVGCRHFQLVDACRLYHFGCRSTGRIRKNKGGRMFSMKWGITLKDFRQNYLSLAKNPDAVRDKKLRISLSGKIRRLFYSWFGIPFTEINAWLQSQEEK